MYETILKTELDKRISPNKMLSNESFINLQGQQQGVAHRLTKLHSFDQDVHETTYCAGSTFTLKTLC